MPETKNEKWFGMRLTPAQKRDIEQLSEQKDAVLEAVQRELEPSEDDEPIEAQPGSVLELTEDLCGSIDDPNLPTDLSTNPKHMEDYGKD
ncbi:MAG: hypothetical protein BRD45_01440 [Bacteroidetes bacterium QS_8_64_10]|nr:MAG: hypothetical protein BRD45_01440 [Bacteroidetes bacterium QS_8_64_10]